MRTERKVGRIGARVEIFRSSQVGAAGNFMACVRVGRGSKMPRAGGVVRPHGAYQTCASGRNPRLAAGRALAKLGRLLAHRTGAFHGL